MQINFLFRQPTFQGSLGHTAAKASRSSFPLAAEVVGGNMSSRMLTISCLLWAAPAVFCSLPEEEHRGCGTFYILCHNLTSCTAGKTSNHCRIMDIPHMKHAKDIGVI